MIARIWEGVVPAEKEEAYREFLAREVLPEIRGIPGNRGVTVLRCAEGDLVRFVVQSQWESLDAIRRFAGDDAERAHLRPAALQFLVDPEPFARHYEVLSLPELPAS